MRILLLGLLVGCLFIPDIYGQNELTLTKDKIIRILQKEGNEAIIEPKKNGALIIKSYKKRDRLQFNYYIDPEGKCTRLFYFPDADMVTNSLKANYDLNFVRVKENKWKFKAHNREMIIEMLPLSGQGKGEPVFAASYFFVAYIVEEKTG